MTGIKAYVLCKVSSGREGDVCRAIVNYDDIVEVNLIYGEYDLIVKVEARSMPLLSFIIDKVRMVPNITFSSTVIVSREISKTRL